jgi:hypothetical protein
MSGCGGCGPEGCNGPCSTKKEAPRDRYTLTDALARVIVDNKVIARTVELYELGVVRVEDLVAQINADKNEGLI